MSIAYDNGTDLGNVSGATPVLTSSHTVNSNNSAVFVITSFSLSTDRVTGVTCGGVAMTNNAGLTSAFEGTAYNAKVWYLFGVSAGVKSIVVTCSNGSVATVYAIALSYTGVLSTVIDNQATATAGSSSPFSQSLTPTVDNCWVIMAGNIDLASPTAGASTTNRISTVSGMWACDNNAAVSPASLTTLSEVKAAAHWSGVIFSISPIDPPTVTTQAVSSASPTSATGNGNVTSDGGITITERGIVWSLTPTPTIADFKSSVSGTTGAFSAPMTGLTINTFYYVRAYFKNASGTIYGNEVTFTTPDVEHNQVIKDISGVEGETYAVSVNVGGSTGTVTLQLGSTGDSIVINAGAGVTVFQGLYGGLSGLIFTASPTFNGYIDNVMWVLILGTATINWTLDTLTNVYPINSSVLFRRVEDKEFDRFRIYRYLDVQFKDLNAYVTVLLKKEANEDLTNKSKEFLVNNTSGETLPFIDKRISMLLKGQALRIGLSNNRLDETFTVCQFVLKGTQSTRKLFDKSKIISV